MSVERCVHMTCDEPGCQSWIGGRPRTVTKARALAKRQGWMRVNGRDVCDQCASPYDVFGYWRERHPDSVFSRGIDVKVGP